MKCFVQISVVIIAVQWCCVVKCKPFSWKKHIYKTFHLGFVPLPPKHFSMAFEKFTPFGPFEFKHTIKKRQIAQAELPPVTNDLLAVEDVPLRIPMTPLQEKAEVKNVEKSPAEVLITSVVEPLEPGKQISFLLPVDSEVVITPAVKDVVAPVPHAVEALVGPEPELKPEVVAPHSSAVIEITAKPIEILQSSEIKPIKPNVVLTTSIESTIPPVLSVPPVLPVPVEKPVPPVPPLPADKNLNAPVITPVINSYPIAPFLYTNIKGIPFYTPTSNIIPFITPSAVPIPEAVIPPAQPPVVKEVVPVVKEEIPPVVKEEPPPNFFVKSSRFVLYFGSMMLQMLSRFVNGEINLNRIPLPSPLPGTQ